MIYTVILCFAAFSTVNAVYGASCPCPENMVCDHGKCICSVDKHYDPAVQSCKDSCENYGINYQNYNYTKWYYPLSAEIRISTFPHLCECVYHCTINPRCVCAMYNAYDGKCSLLSQHPVTSEDLFPLSAVTTLVRICGNMSESVCPPGQVAEYQTSNCVISDTKVEPICTNCTYGRVLDPSDSTRCICPAGTKRDPEYNVFCIECEGNTISAAGDVNCTECATNHIAINNHKKCALIRLIEFKTVDQTGKKDDDSKAENAVDGNYETCAVTADRDNPYWYGNLSEEAVVTSVSLSNVGAGENIPLIVSIIDKNNITVSHCDMWFGEQNSSPVFHCPANNRGSYVRVKRLTKDGATRKLRICEIIVKGYPASEIEENKETNIYMERWLS